MTRTFMQPAVHRDRGEGVSIPFMLRLVVRMDAPRVMNPSDVFRPLTDGWLSV